MSQTEGRPAAPEGSSRAALQALPDVRRGQGAVHPPDGMLALGLRAGRGPSVATPHRAVRRLDRAACERALGRWFAAQGLAPGAAPAIDGKTPRGLHGEAPRGVHPVAAYAPETRAVLA